MNAQARQRTILLLGLMVILVLVVGWGSLKPMLFDLAEVAGVRGGTDERLVSGEVEILRMSDLERPMRDYEPDRNIFRLGVEPPPPPKPPPPPRKPVAAPAPTRRPKAEPKGPVPPPLNLSLIGIIGPEHRRVAVLRDGAAQKIINALEQDLIEGKFIVHHIGYQTVDFKFVGFPDVEPERLKIGG